VTRHLQSVPNVASLLEPMQKANFHEDTEKQLWVLERIHSFGKREQKILLERMGRRCGMDEDRLIAVLELRSNQDRIKALSLPRDRSPQRKPDERIYPTTGWLGQYLDWAIPTSAPLAWHFWCAASLISAAARRQLWVDAGMDEPVYLANYYFLVGPSGSGKSTAIKKAKDILKRANRRLLEIGQNSTVPHDPSIYLGPPSATLEAWLDEMSHYYTTHTSGPQGNEPTMVLQPDYCCFIAQDEVVVLLGQDQHGAERWFNALFQFSDCPDEWRDSKVSAKRDGHYRELFNVAVTTLFGSAPEHLVQRMSSAVFSGGYIGRTILSYRTHSGRMHSSRANTDPVQAEALAKGLVAIAQRPPGRMVLTSEARDWYDNFLAENHAFIRECDPRFVGAYERAGWHTVKTAGVLALAEDVNARQITLEQLEKAKELVDLERPGAERVVGGTRSYDPAERMSALERAIQQPGQLDYSTILNRMRGIYTSEERLNAAIQTLLSAGRLRCYPPTDGSGVLYSVESWDPRAESEDDEGLT